MSEKNNMSDDRGNWENMPVNSEKRPERRNVEHKKSMSEPFSVPLGSVWSRVVCVLTRVCWYKLSSLPLVIFSSANYQLQKCVVKKQRKKISIWSRRLQEHLTSRSSRILGCDGCLTRSIVVTTTYSLAISHWRSHDRWCISSSDGS